MLASNLPLVADNERQDSTSVGIEKLIIYGDVLDSVAKKLTTLGLKAEVLHSTAIPPEILAAKFNIIADQETIEKTEFFGIDMLKQNGFDIGFNREKQLVSFQRLVSADKNSRGKSLHEAFRKLENHEGNDATKSIEIANTNDLLLRMERAIRFGDTKENVVTKLTELGFDVKLSNVGIHSPEQVRSAGKKLAEFETEEVTYYEIDMVDDAGVIFYFNFHGKLYKYRNTHNYKKQMIGKSFAEVQDQLLRALNPRANQ